MTIKTLLEKEEWSAKDWDSYLNNLNFLCAKYQLKKSEFNKAIGVANAFRRDIARPGKGTILSICNKFNVTAEWMSVSHAWIKDKQKRETISEDQQPYNVVPIHTGQRGRQTISGS